MMNIEELVQKYYSEWARQDMTMTQALEAALNEQAAGYEERLKKIQADDLMAQCMEQTRNDLIAAGVIDKGCSPMFLADAVISRIRNLEQKDYTGGDAELLRDRIRHLEARLGGYLTVGGGHIVHGTAEALARVQAYILLDSKHPVEARDTNRYFAKQLQAAEQRIRQLEAECMPDYTGGDAELLRQRMATDVSRCVTNAYDHIQAEEYSDALSSLLEAREHIAAALPKKEGE